MHRKTESDHCECQISSNCKYLLRRHRDKAGLFKTLFACVFNMDSETRGSQYPELESLPLTVKMINSQLTLKLCRICCSNGTSTNMCGLKGFLKELDDITAKLILIFEQSWESRDTPGDWIS